MILALVDHFSNGNKAQFANKIGVTPQTISTWISRNTFDTEKIFALCEGVSAEWLLTGKGSMLKNEQENPCKDEDKGLIRELIEKNSELSRQLGEQINENTHLQQKNMELQTEIDSLKNKRECTGAKKGEKRHSVYSPSNITIEPEE